MSSPYKRAFRLDRRSPDDATASVDDELAFHLESMVEELVEQGWGQEEARAEALRQFGDFEFTRRYCADLQTRRGRVERGVTSVDDMWQDLKYALRTVAKAPGYAALVVVTLAFGIAANTTIFSVMNAYFFRPLPFGDAEALVHVTQVDPVSGFDMDRFSLPIYDDWRARTSAFEDLAAYSYRGTNITGPEGPEAVNLSDVTANLFDVLKVEAALGRTFVPEDAGPGADPVVVLDHRLWERRYLGDPGIIGRVVNLDGTAHTVVGVMPEDFVFPFGGVRLWTPVRESATAVDRARAPYLLVGRMAAGWTRERVDADLTRIQQQLRAEYPDADGGWDGVTVLPLRQALNFVWDILAVSFSILLGAVIFVLAIACVNVASLTLARAGTRVREVAVRSALGASRRRIVRQLITESLLLALAGGVVGVAMAYGATAVVGPAIPEDLYRVGDITIDTTVLAFSLVVTLATPLLFGLAPALSATRRSLVDGLKEGAKGSGGLGASRVRRALVSVQVALAVVLTTGAGLMLRSFSAVQDQELGFDDERVLYVGVRPSEADYDADQVMAYIERAVEEVGAVPGVESASATLYLPLNHESALWRFAPPEMAGAGGDEWPAAVANRPYPGYFAAMGIPLLAGRDFDRGDAVGAAPVAIVNQALAERYWPGETPVGRTILVGEPGNPEEVTVVGVVGGVRHEALDGDADRPQMYRPALQSRFRRHFLVARTQGDPSSLVGPVRQALQRLDPNLPVTARPMAAVVQENLLQWSLGSVFLGIFGGGALLLATLGIYGLISFSVSQRQRELGVRIALGASRSEIRRAVVGDGLRLTTVGLGVGLLAALGLGQVIASVLFGVTPFDPVTLGGVMVIFLSVAALASFVPAERASRTDPITVLKSE